MNYPEIKRLKRKLERLTLAANKYILILFISSLVLHACKTTREISESGEILDIKPYPATKIYRNISELKISPEYLTIKRFNCTIRQGKDTKSFKGALKMVKDSAIWITVNGPMNIEFSRILILKDSTYILDRLNKDYIVKSNDDYYELFNIEVDIEFLQSIILSEIYTSRNNERKVKEYVSDIRDNQYVLSTQRISKLHRKSRKGKDLKEDYLEYRINPLEFNIEGLTYIDFDNQRTMVIDYQGKGVAPNQINGRIINNQNQIKFELNIDKISTEKINTLSFNVPARYKHIY